MEKVTGIENIIENGCTESFEHFRSEICHSLKVLGDTRFVEIAFRDDWPRRMWKKSLYAEAFYVLAILDYLSSQGITCDNERYSDLRSEKLKDPLFPLGVLYMEKIMPQADKKGEYTKKCMNSYCGHYFMKYNIMEDNIRDAI